MDARLLTFGEVIDEPDLAEWEILDDNFPLGVVREYLLARAPGAPLGPKGQTLWCLYTDATMPFDVYWRDGAAVVVNANYDARVVHAIARHGPAFRLIGLLMR